MAESEHWTWSNCYVLEGEKLQFRGKLQWSQYNCVIGDDDDNGWETISVVYKVNMISEYIIIIWVVHYIGNSFNNGECHTYILTSRCVPGLLYCAYKWSHGSYDILFL